MQKELDYIYQDKTYKIVVVYKKMRCISARIRDDIFYFHVPNKTSNKVIFDAIKKLLPRLLKRRMIMPVNDDNVIYFLGKKYQIANLKEININEKLYCFETKDELEEKLNKEFYKLIVDKTRLYEQLMKTVNHKIRCKKVKSIFGSNSIKKHNITFSLTLSKYNWDCIDSVIIHELAHDFVCNHSKDFYQVVLKYCPNYWIYRKKLIKKEYV